MRTGHDCKAIDEPRCENVTDGFKNRAMSRGVKRKKGKEENIMRKKVVAALMAVTMVAAYLQDVELLRLNRQQHRQQKRQHLQQKKQHRQQKRQLL